MSEGRETDRQRQRDRAREHSFGVGESGGEVRLGSINPQCSPQSTALSNTTAVCPHTEILHRREPLVASEIRTVVRIRSSTGRRETEC